MIKVKGKRELLQKGYFYNEKNQKIRKFDLINIFSKYNI